MKDFIAIALFKIGVKPKCTSFIDGETLAFGYGKLDGDIGLWEYQIPFRYTKDKI